MSKVLIKNLLILNHLLLKGKKVLYWNSVSGYGLTAADFDESNAPLSGKIFARSCEELLKNRLIGQVKKSKKIPRYYTITPLGICYLLINEPKQIEYFDFRRFLTILKLFHNKSTSKILNPINFKADLMLKRLKKTHSNNNLCMEFMYSMIQHFQLSQNKYVTISTNISPSLKLVLAYFTLKSKEVYFGEIIGGKINYEKYLANEEFHSVFSLYMLILFFQYLTHSTNNNNAEYLKWVEEKNPDLIHFVTSLRKHISQEMKANIKNYNQ